jgi:hypothetical protein
LRAPGTPDGCGPDRVRPAACAAQCLARLLAKPESAARLLGWFDAQQEELGVAPWVAKMNEGTLAAVHAQLDEAAFAAAWEGGQKLTVDEAPALALDSLA